MDDESTRHPFPVDYDVRPERFALARATVQRYGTAGDAHEMVAAPEQIDEPGTLGGTAQLAEGARQRRVLVRPGLAHGCIACGGGRVWAQFGEAISDGSKGKLIADG
jgi:hypothetical protein